MPAHPQPRARGPARSRRSALASAGLLALGILVAMLGLAELVEIPGLSYALMAGTWGLDLLVLLLLLTVVGLLLLRRRPSRARAAALVLLCVGLVLTASTGWRQVSFAHSVGADLDVWALTGIGQQGSAPDEQPIVLREPTSGQTLRAGVWLPRDPGTGEELSAAQVRAEHPGGVPVVVLLHGGGWQTGNRLNPMTRGQAAWFAEQGYLAIALDYPLSTSALPTWQIAESASTCGLAWAGAHAADYGGDSGRLSLVGDSAGGNLALEIAYRQALGTLDNPCGGEVPTVGAVCVTYPIADPVGFHDNADLVMAPFTSERAERYTGGVPAAVPERYEAIDPALKVRQAAEEGLAAHLPPTLLVHGARDHVVPVAGTLELDRELTRAGAEHETVILPATDHVFDLNPGSVGSQVWRHLALEMLQAHGLGVNG